MSSSLTLLIACIASAASAALLTAWLMRKQVGRARAEAATLQALREKQLRETHAAELLLLRETLVADVAQLQARSRRPLRTFVEGIFS
ncbi:MAG: hypothetical protein ACOY3X_05125 [Pseudomonadota bacterium]